MKILVKPHTIDIQSNPINELEINVTHCYFEFSEEITNDFVKEAYFTLDDGETYKQIIINNECEIPSEVLVKQGIIEIGVVAYLVEDEETIKRYNPKPGYFTSWVGSLKDAENSQEITPSEMEQYEQALQGGLNDISDALDDLQDKVDSGYFDGADGITPIIGNNGNWYLGETDTGKPSRGIQGPAGQDGQDGRDGTNGADGYSPSASVSKSGSVATITITDKNGTTTATVSDGTNGQNGQDGADGIGVPSGGTTGQVLSKASETDYDTEWVNASSGDLSNYYTKSDTDTLLNGKQNTLTAGTNMEITANNTINSTIKYYTNSTNKSLRVGNDNIFSSNCTAIGYNSATNGQNATALGTDSYANANNVAVGNNAQSLWDHGIAIGNGARNSKNNQATFGSTTSPINEARIMTSSGEKVLATESYVDTEISTALGTIETTLGGI